VTAEQLRAVVGRLVAAGQWHDGDPPVLVVTDAGYDVTRLAFLLADPPIEVVGRLRSDRVLRLPKPPRPPATWPAPQHTTSTDTARYGTAVAASGNRVPPRLTHRGCWIDHHGELPVIEGTLIRLQVEHLPGDRDPKPVWPWSSVTGATAADGIAGGRRSCAAATWHTPSGCSNRPWAGPPRRSAPPKRRTAGPGW
jgi:hypothetical protein